MSWNWLMRKYSYKNHSNFRRTEVIRNKTFNHEKVVTARFCEGGHICSLPRECCTQGCCPPYQSGPRQLPPPSEHVLNLFFISHWFFWCLVVAIILAVLCAYSLWKKRRTLCGWGFPEHHAQSEGDSAGSCYAPPQYSRCSSFHHPPPPYTEVTSKPDLYPLVFTCNSDNGKNGSSYLMVQYFRNYIVRPAGSGLSAASTVDSLSSSFICNANEANTLVPPPYSRAASPDLGFSSHFQFALPRSASQLVCPNGNGQQDLSGNNMVAQQAYHYQHRNLGHNIAINNSLMGSSTYTTHMRNSNSDHFHNEDSAGSSRSGSADGSNNDGVVGESEHRTTGFMQSQSDQHFRYIANSNSVSDIFVNNTSVTNAGIMEDDRLSNGSAATEISTTHPQAGGTPVIYSNGCIKPKPLHRVSTNPTQFNEAKREPLYNSCNSIEGIAITVPVAANSTNTEFRDLHLLRRSLETCCQLLQQQNQQSQNNFTISGSPIRINELTKKFTDEGLRSYVTSGTCSGVSSLANIGTPSSPPQATSPTGEVKEILDQIRQLHEGVSYEDILLFNSRPALQHTMSSPSPNHTNTNSIESNIKLQRCATMIEQQNVCTSSSNAIFAAEGPNHTTIPNTNIKSQQNPQHNSSNSIKSINSIVSMRPSTLQQSKKKFYTSKPNKAMYIPMMSNPSPPGRYMLKSPVGSVGVNFFTNRGRVRRGWISRSAPTTPGTSLPPNRLGDDSPLLNEHDEDQEGEQNAELE
ncbi:uncharacterized protein LOC119672660 [Teleopsis dalmanni]|uniref:uncharacterized protein LOC119670901 n=1 Tax=Teleopsis dalmanni TaxID=139649 RepID=UPI0018CE5F8D|nr:uncharacterized protein LOC119670901 [Teleopsis dalmanni]XP_037939696.1 uncharacterized protein LOC119672660 [Teleopsis dalmanni]